MVWPPPLPDPFPHVALSLFQTHWPPCCALNTRTRPSPSHPSFALAGWSSRMKPSPPRPPVLNVFAQMSPHPRGLRSRGLTFPSWRWTPCGPPPRPHHRGMLSRQQMRKECVTHRWRGSGLASLTGSNTASETHCTSSGGRRESLRANQVSGHLCPLSSCLLASSHLILCSLHLLIPPLPSLCVATSICWPQDTLRYLKGQPCPPVTGMMKGFAQWPWLSRRFPILRSLRPVCPTAILRGRRDTYSVHSAVRNPRCAELNAFP